MKLIRDFIGYHATNELPVQLHDREINSIGYTFAGFVITAIYLCLGSLSYFTIVNLTNNFLPRQLDGLGADSADIAIFVVVIPQLVTIFLNPVIRSSEIVPRFFKQLNMPPKGGIPSIADPRCFINNPCRNWRISQSSAFSCHTGLAFSMLMAQINWQSPKMVKQPKGADMNTATHYSHEPAHEKAYTNQTTYLLQAQYLLSAVIRRIRERERNQKKAHQHGMANAVHHGGA